MNEKTVINMSEADITANIPAESAGCFVLSEGEFSSHGRYYVTLVGSASNLRNKLLGLLRGPIKYVKCWFVLIESAQERYEVECADYHTYSAVHQLHNVSHPEKPQGVDVECLQCAIDNGWVEVVNEDTLAYNIEDTSDEDPPSNEGDDWTEYWKYWTHQPLTGATCACCGCALSASNRNGAHVRKITDADNTRNGYIALYCDSCNNWNDKSVRKLLKGSWVVKTIMSQNHRNAK